MEDNIIYNPFRDESTGRKGADPAVMVIFGATGNLTKTKLFPALFELAATGQLPQPFAIVGFARRSWSNKEFRNRMEESARSHSRYGNRLNEIWPKLSENLYYLSSNFSDDDGYRRLKKKLEALEKAGPGVNRLFYLATQPSYYAEIVSMLGRSGLARPGNGWIRMIIEKPIGHDLASAQELNGHIEKSFEEKQIYRIDHYLGKETVQNMLVFRFANGIFEPLWNHRYIDHIQITVSETTGVEGRGRYFEEAGILRDMVQNHILQLVSLFAMEPPASFSPEAVRNEKVKVLSSLRPMTTEDVSRYTVRGQYGHGLIGNEEVNGYREEENVHPESLLETYVSLKMLIDNWRWAGVPFFIRVGKRLPKRETVITTRYKDVPHLLFRQAGGWPEPNVLTLRIQPDEGISLQFSSKIPGPLMNIRPFKMDFRYGLSFEQALPDAYVRLILDCLSGDSTLFIRRDEIEAAWFFITEILKGWEKLPPPNFPNYEAGTWGPSEADDFIRREGHRWLRV